MSRRILPVLFAFLAVSAARALAQDAVAQPDVANSKFQVDGVIGADQVYVRSGPGEGYYPTQVLTKGVGVTVVGKKFDWLKIVPPDGSFSYVGAVFVDRTGDNPNGRINRNDVNVRAGSLVNEMKTTVQTRLNAGDAVQILGKEDEYLKIKPPAGAYLYINQDYVTIAHPPTLAANDSAPGAQPVAQNTAPADSQPKSTASPSIDGAIVTSTPTTAPSQAVAAATMIKASPTTNPSAVAVAPSTQPAVAVAPPPSAEELFGQFETQFVEMSKQPLDAQPIDAMMASYQSIAKSPDLSDDLKRVVDIRIATLQARADNKVKLVEIQKLQKVAAARQLALQAEQQELTERLKEQAIQVYAAVGTLQPSSLQVGGGTLYRLVDPVTGRTEIYIRTADPKVTALMGQFIGVNGDATTDPQLSLRVIEPTGADAVDQAKVNVSVMASIIPPSMLARQASAN